MVIHANYPYRDLVLDLGTNGIERYSELVVVLFDQVKRLTDQEIPVKFEDSIVYNNSRNLKSKGVDCTLTFQETSDPKITGSSFKSGKNNNHVIHYK